ncbi:MAG TPA: universal stress protein [Solirubrobacteraceae bacterium]|nr:universal stress protein [Solirubrobacteraceae bacterium]
MFVVGYDGSDGANRPLDVAIELARSLGEPLVVAFAAQPPGRQVGDEYRAHLELLEERGRNLTDAAVARAAAAGVDAEAVVADLRVVDLLLDLADERGARAIVVGTYGESPLRGAVLGSTPHKLLHLSKVPVLAVPA